MVQQFRLPAASKMTGMSVDFLRREIRRGLLPATKLGTCVVIDEHALADYLNTRRIRTQAPAKVAE